MVCKELGFANATTVYGSSTNKGGIVWIDNVQCAGNESTLLLCAHDGWKDHRCTNAQKAGVACPIPEGRACAISTAESLGYNLFCKFLETTICYFFSCLFALWINALFVRQKTPKIRRCREKFRRSSNNK